MKRRAFISLLGSAAAAWPLTARAQQPAKLPIIGYLGPSTRSIDVHRLGALVQQLRELGWIEGRTIVIEYRWAEGRNEHLAEVTAEFGRCHCHGGNRSGRHGKADDIGDPDCLRGG